MKEDIIIRDSSKVWWGKEGCELNFRNWDTVMELIRKREEKLRRRGEFIVQLKRNACSFWHKFTFGLFKKWKQ